MPADEQTRRESEAKSAWRRDFARYGGLGMQFAAAVGLFAYVGFRLDRWLETLPLFLIVGVLLGFAAGMLALLARLPKAGDHKHNSRINKPIP